MVYDGIEPTTYTQINKEEKWKKAMKEELEALQMNNTWSLVPYDSKMNIIGNKSVCKIKRKSYGSIKRY